MLSMLLLTCSTMESYVNISLPADVRNAEKHHFKANTTLALELMPCHFVISPGFTQTASTRMDDALDSMTQCLQCNGHPTARCVAYNSEVESRRLEETVPKFLPDGMSLTYLNP